MYKQKIYGQLNCIWNFLAVTTVAAVFAGCINWADAPRLEKVDSLPKDTGKILTAAFPEAKLISPVYQRLMENRGQRYVVVSMQFLFESADGRSHHGRIDKAGVLTTRSVVFADRLPEKLAIKLLQAPDAPLAGATLRSRPWSYTENDRLVYQFEFMRSGRSGLCTTELDGPFRHVQFFVPATP